MPFYEMEEVMSLMNSSKPSAVASLSVI